MKGRRRRRLLRRPGRSSSKATGRGRDRAYAAALAAATPNTARRCSASPSAKTSPATTNAPSSSTRSSPPIKPVDTHALLNLGVLYEDEGRYDEAVRCYRAVLAAFPNHRRARQYLRDAEGSLTMHLDEEHERRPERGNFLLRMPISEFELSVRARNCLAKMDIQTLADLVIEDRERAPLLQELRRDHAPGDPLAAVGARAFARA